MLIQHVLQCVAYVLRKSGKLIWDGCSVTSYVTCLYNHVIPLPLFGCLWLKFIRNIAVKVVLTIKSIGLHVKLQGQ